MRSLVQSEIPLGGRLGEDVDGFYLGRLGEDVDGFYLRRQGSDAIFINSCALPYWLNRLKSSQALFGSC